MNNIIIPFRSLLSAAPPFENTNSLQFDGLTASVNLGTPTETAFDRLDTFSISAWIKLDGVKNHTVISNQLNGSPYRGINFIVNTSNKVVVFLAHTSSSRFTWTSTITLSDAIWYNITFTYDGSSDINGGNIYINGALDANPLDSGVVSLTTVSGIPYYLGARQGAANFFDGNIDEVSIYNTELTPLVIANDIYNLGYPKDLTALNPLVWYRNGDGDTYPTIIDHGSVGSDGTMTNMIAGDIGPPVPPSFNTKSLLFDGLDSYLDVGKPTVFDNATNFSISTWFRTTDSALQGVYKYLPNPTGAASGWIELSINSTRFSVILGNGAISYGQTAAGTALNTWYNVTVVFDGSGATNADRLKMYIDGVDTTLTFPLNDIPTSTSNMTTAGPTTFQIGARFNGADYFDGNIDEPAVFDYSLTQLQIDSIFDFGVQDLNNTVGLTAPVNYWRMGDSVGDVFPTIEDVGSAASNDGTMTAMLVTDIVNEVP